MLRDQLILGRWYRHYKGNLYQLQFIAKPEAGGEDLCIYWSPDDPSNTTWSRPIGEFLEKFSPDYDPDDDFAICTHRGMIKYLNDAFNLDPFWMQKLIEFRPDCNEAIADHPSIQVWDKEDGSHKAGFLGLLNGFFGVFTSGPFKGSGPVAVVIDDTTNELKGFQLFGGLDVKASQE